MPAFRKPNLAGVKKLHVTRCDSVMIRAMLYQQDDRSSTRTKGTRWVLGHRATGPQRGGASREEGIFEVSLKGSVAEHSLDMSGNSSGGRKAFNQRNSM